MNDYRRKPFNLTQWINGDIGITRSNNLSKFTRELTDIYSDWKYHCTEYKNYDHLKNNIVYQYRVVNSFGKWAFNNTESDIVNLVDFEVKHIEQL